MAALQLFSLPNVCAWLKPKSKAEWPIIGFVLACLPLLFFGGPSITRDFVGRMAWNLGHYFFFAAVAYLILVRLKASSVAVQFAAMVGVIGIGVVVEIIQIFTPRDADINDVLNNAVGIMAAFFWFQRANWRIWLGRVVFSGIVVGHCLFVAAVAVWVFMVTHQQPWIADFESRTELYRWQGRGEITLSDTHVSEGKHSLQFELSTRRFSGITLSRLPSDWQGYEVFTFDIFNPQSETIELVIRVHDRWHRRSRFRFDDRYNHRLTVNPGWNNYRIELNDIKHAPSDREMDLANIEEIVLFSVGLDQPVRLYTDNWKLQ